MATSEIAILQQCLYSAAVNLINQFMRAQLADWWLVIGGRGRGRCSGIWHCFACHSATPLNRVTKASRSFVWFFTIYHQYQRTKCKLKICLTDNGPLGWLEEVQAGMTKDEVFPKGTINWKKSGKSRGCSRIKFKIYTNAYWWLVCVCLVTVIGVYSLAILLSVCWPPQKPMPSASPVSVHRRWSRWRE